MTKQPRVAQLDDIKMPALNATWSYAHIIIIARLGMLSNSLLCTVHQLMIVFVTRWAANVNISDPNAHCADGGSNPLRSPLISPDERRPMW